MAKYPNILCRVNAIKPKFVVRYVEHFPKKPMPAADFYKYVEDKESGFYSNNYKQAPLQWGLFYEENGICYPRFDHNITEKEAEHYIDRWLHNLVVPNPYCNLSQIEAPTNLVILICEYMKEHPEVEFIHDVAYGACKEKVKAVDILKATLEQSGLFRFERANVRHYKVTINKNVVVEDFENKDDLLKLIDYFKQIYDPIDDIIELPESVLGYSISIKDIPNMPHATEVFSFSNVFNYKIHFSENFNNIYKTYKDMTNSEYYHIFDSPELKFYQQIYYGAPGTGKSNAIKAMTAEGGMFTRDCTFRTTFHPDSDYASFVGAYKPISKKPQTKILDLNSLSKELGSQVNADDKSSFIAFGVKYYASFLNHGFDYKQLLCIDNNFDFINAEYIKAGVQIGKSLAKTETKIVYEFRPQAFLKAYIKAWKNPDKNVALVVEEINRGNCAQIFGDIFQLLDREKNGLSKYPIECDLEMQELLSEEFANDSEIFGAAITVELYADNKDNINNYYSAHYENAFDKIINGEILALPMNLSILATMNTSDQSLFPMDSAFKRRWEWIYEPIVEGKKEDGTSLGWKIEIDETHSVDWWKFLRKINAVIYSLTSSEDKQLGYFFCQPDEEDGVTISKNLFVGKVVFYLWNEIFKDYAFEHDVCKKENKSETLYFADFYEGKSIVRQSSLEIFFEHLDENQPKLDGKDVKLIEEIVKKTPETHTPTNAANGGDQTPAVDNPEQTEETPTENQEA